MVAIESPRRILGDRDVNKPLLPKQSIVASSPRKLASFSSSIVVHEKSLDLGNFAQVLLSPKMQDSSSASVISPSSGMKRGVASLEDAQDGPRRKQAVVALPRDDSPEAQSKGVDCESRPPQSAGTGGLVGTAPREAVPDHCQLQRSVSPDSSFDATQDSEFPDSQNTTLTEPEDLAPLPVPALMAYYLPRRIVSQAETRENAEALRLRLKVAMYKVKTNQTDLPLCQLQIRSSRAEHPYPEQPTRTPLPTLRSAPILKPATTHSYPSPDRTMYFEAEDQKLTTIPSSSSPRPPLMSPEPSSTYCDPAYNNRDFATPILPRSRDSYSRHSRGSPEAGPEVEMEVKMTSSVVKGRAADGLLSLMGGGVRNNLCKVSDDFVSAGYPG